jgi:outer membrane protein
MKKVFFILVCCFGITFASLGQKNAYIDSKYILENVPAYAEAQEKLQKYSERWQKEIDDRYAVLQKMKDAYDREEVLLPQEVKEKRKAEMDTLLQQAMDLQKSHFGVNGDLFQKRQELIKPIQDEIFDALSKVASKGNYSFVFDKANQSNLIFADSKYDLSDRVLKEMGISGKQE